MPVCTGYVIEVISVLLLFPLAAGQLLKNKVTRTVRGVRLEHDMLKKHCVFRVFYKWQLASGTTKLVSLQEHSLCLYTH